jgi:hypothetical protein
VIRVTVRAIDGAPFHVPLDPPYFVAEQPEVGIHHDGNCLGDSETDLVDTRHPLEEIRDKALDTEDLAGPDLVKNGVRDQDNEEGDDKVIIDNVDVGLDIGIMRGAYQDDNNIDNRDRDGQVERVINI